MTYEPTDADKLAAHVVVLLGTISPRNLRNGKTTTITVPRIYIDQLAAELERQYPGWLAHQQREEHGI